MSASAHADTIKNYTFSTNFWPSTGVTGSFTYNSTKGTLSGSSLTFSGNSVFGALGTVNLGNPSQQYGNWLFVYTVNVLNPTTHNTDKVTFDIYMTANGPSIVSGSICDGRNCGGFYTSQLSMRVPEGGSTAAYLFTALSVIGGAVFVSDRKRRQAACRLT